MSNQAEDGWYPECSDCGCGNLGRVYCDDCYEDLNKLWEKRFDDLEKDIEIVLINCFKFKINIVADILDELKKCINKAKQKQFENIQKQKVSDITQQKLREVRK